MPLAKAAQQGSMFAQVDAMLLKLFNRACSDTEFCGTAVTPPVACDEKLIERAHSIVNAVNLAPPLCDLMKLLGKLNSLISAGFCGCTEREQANLNEAANIIREKILANMNMSQQTFQEKYCTSEKPESLRKFLTSLAVRENFCGIESPDTINIINGLTPEFTQSFLCKGVLCPSSSLGSTRDRVAK